MNREPLSILYTQPSTGGGSTLSLYELVRGLNKKKYKPIVLFKRRSPYHELFEKCGAKLILLDERVSPRLLKKQRNNRSHRKWKKIIALPRKAYDLLFRDAPLALHVAHLIKHERVALIHHNGSLASARPMVIAAMIAGIPQVCHFRMFGRIPLVAKKLAPLVDAYVYISRAIADYYCDQGLSPEKGRLIYNPHDYEAFAKVTVKEVKAVRNEFDLSDDDFLVSNIGRVDSWKGQDYFVRAMAEVQRVFPNTKALIVGDCYPTPEGESYRRRLHDIVDEVRLSECVIFTKHRDDIPRLMAASDVVVHSASKPEPFGRVIVEAMMAARPVIATAAGGVLDIIEDRVTGMLVPLKSASGIAEAIKELLSEPEKTKEMGQRAQVSAQKRFSVQQHVTAMEQLYQDILAKKRNPSSRRYNQVVQESDNFK